MNNHCDSHLGYSDEKDKGILDTGDPTEWFTALAKKRYFTDFCKMYLDVSVWDDYNLKESLSMLTQN